MHYVMFSYCNTQRNINACFIEPFINLSRFLKRYTYGTVAEVREEPWRIRVSE